MPIMVPPGQGITVTTPAGQTTQPVQQTPQAPQRQALPPSPFREAHGPDVVIMPHHVQPKPKQPQAAPQQPSTQAVQPQPAQMSMRGRLVQLARQRMHGG